MEQLLSTTSVLGLCAGFIWNRAMWAASGLGGSYLINQSIRFNDDDSAYMYRTPSVAGNRKTWTWSGWVKRGRLTSGASQFLFSMFSDSSNRTDLLLAATTDTLTFNSRTAAALDATQITTQVFRDPSAWYHIVLAVDTTNATAGDRTRIYVNGIEVTAFSTDTQFGLNDDTWANHTVAQDVGRYGAAASYFDGYLADVHFIDGAALTAASFGETDAFGNWVPIEYAGATTTDFIPGATGTTIGDMVTGGGLAAATDGNKAQTYLTGCAGNTTSGPTDWVGKDYSAVGGKTVTKALVYATTSQGFNNDGNTARRLKISLKGSATGAWAGEETVLDSHSFGDNGYTAHNNEILELTPSTPANYDYYQFFFEDETATNMYACISEMEFFEAGTGYGTNGFRITGENSAALGTDYSGNSNTYTTSGLTTADQMLDSPTDDADNGVGNYCTFSPIIPSALAITLADGNLKATLGNSSSVRGTHAFGPTGKYYFEFTATDTGYGTCGFHAAALAYNKFLAGDAGNEATAPNNGQGYAWQDSSGIIRHNNVAATSSPASTFTTGDILGWYVDFDNDAIWLSKNGTLENGATQSEVEAGTTTNAIWTGTLAGYGSQLIHAGCNGGGGFTWELNTGQSAFNTALYSGYTGIGTAYLPAPTVTNPSAEFGAVIDTEANIFATMAAELTSTNYVRVYKNRDASETWAWTFSHDSSNEYAVSSTATYQATRAMSGSNSWLGFEFNCDTYAKTGSQAHTNGGGDTTVTHNVGHTNYCVLLFPRNNGEVWMYHPGFTAGTLVHLTSDMAPAANTQITNVAANSFDIGTGHATDTYDYLVIPETSGLYALPTYTGNAAADGTFVYTDTSPLLAFFQNSSAAVENICFHDVDGSGNEVENRLYMNYPNAESLTTTYGADFNSNGIKWRAAVNANTAVTYYGVVCGRSAFGGVGVSQARAR